MTEYMTVMIIDGGARGHVLSESYENDPCVKRIIVAPGNDFVVYNRGKEVIIAKDSSLKDPKSLLTIAQKYKPDLTDVAQEDALALGMVDLLKTNGFNVFGHIQEAAIIEWDKEWSRGFMKRHDIPSTHFTSFDFDEEMSARMYVRDRYNDNPETLLFVKASGLCAGKGALACRSLNQAYENIARMKGFGKAGRKFLIEDGIVGKDGTVGEEFSYVVITDGHTYRAFKPGQDNKLAKTFDEGEQTGGMGANAPALVVTREVAAKVERRIVMPAIKGMAEEGHTYAGILYVGGMLVDNEPVTVEFNARPGDPETQVMWPGVANYPEMVLASLEGKLSEVRMRDDIKYRWCVVGASRGYPGDYLQAKGKRIYGMEEAGKLRGISIYGAGILIQDGKFYANGGRLFSIVGEGRTPLEARQIAYEGMSHINIEGNNLQFRTDIGWRDVDRYLRDSSIFQ